MHSNPRKPGAGHPDPKHLNMAVIIGTMTNEPVHRELADGTLIVQFDVRTSIDVDDRTATISVPVAWRDPTTAAVGALTPGTVVIATGRVERRFFRSGGATLTRTELIAERCIPARRAKGRRSMLDALARELDRRSDELS